MNSNDKFHIIPKNDKKCVWMEAGVVSYKICDRNFECDTCPLDIGLRGDEFIAKNHPNQDYSPTIKQVSDPCDSHDPSYGHLLKYKLDENRYGHPGHCWIEVLSQSRVRIGIDGKTLTYCLLNFKN